MDSKQQQGYCFGVWLNAIKNINDVIYINGFGFNPCVFDKESIRYLLKLLDYDNYPRDEMNRPISYANLTASQLHSHMDFISSEIYHSGYCFNEKDKNFIEIF